jgi:hypothetical protein
MFPGIPVFVSLGDDLNLHDSRAKLRPQAERRGDQVKAIDFHVFSDIESEKIPRWKRRGAVW